MTPVCTSATETTTPGEWLATRLTTRAQIALAACACGGATVFLFAVDPSRHAVYPQCPLYNSTGIYCAGCGATRALYALLHGRVLVALHDNALLVAALPLIFYMVGSHLLRAWRADAWPVVTIESRPLFWRSATIFFVLIAFMLLRNLPGAPFAWLRPN